MLIGQGYPRAMNTAAQNYCHRVLESYAKIPQSEWRRVRSHLKSLHMETRQFFIREGEFSNHIAFIVSGVYRVFCITSAGVEKTLAFRSEGQFLAAFTPFIKKQDCWYSIQALEPGELLYLTLDELAAFPVASDPCWDSIFRKYILQLYIEKEDRERSLLTEDAQTRYRSFVESYPDLEKRIHNFHIASYLGISHVTLSRIRGEMKNLADQAARS